MNYHFTNNQLGICYENTFYFMLKTTCLDLDIILSLHCFHICVVSRPPDLIHHIKQTYVGTLKAEYSDKRFF